MTDPAKDPAENTSKQMDQEPPSPDDLVHMYGGSLLIAVPLILIALVVYFFFIR